MRHSIGHMRRASVALVAAVMGILPAALPGPAGAQTMPMPMGRSGCDLSQAAFCDTFDEPYTGGGRTGQLDPGRWSISRHSGLNGPGQNMFNLFVPSDAMHCRTPVTGVVPPNDYFLCGVEFGESEHFMDAFNDGGSYVYNDARIRQPFDFAGRTGTIVFDVDAKTAGGHGWWVEMWVTDEPVPGPHFDTFTSPPRNGVGLAFSGPCNTFVPPGSNGAPKGGLGSVYAVHDYNVDLILPWINSPNGLNWTHQDCYTAAPDMMNHFKVLINQQRLELWATDTMSSDARLMDVVENLNLSFSRGFVHFEHAGYNAEKATPGGASNSQTYHWDNIGFDGPVLPVPAQYSIPDSLTPGPRGGVNTGYGVAATSLWQHGPLTFTNVNPNGATAATLTLSVMTLGGQSIDYHLNDAAWHSYHFPFQTNGMPAAIPVNLSELQSGSNTIDFRTSDSATVIANIDLVMAGVSNQTSGGSATGTPQQSDHQMPDMTMPMPMDMPMPGSTEQADGSG